MSKRRFGQTMALIQARLRLLETQAKYADQLDAASDLLDEFSEELEALFPLDSSFSQEWEQEQELAQSRARVLQALSREAKESLLLVLSSTNLLEYHADSLSNTSKNRYFQQIRAGSQHFNRLIEELLLLSESPNIGPGFQPDSLELMSLCHLSLMDQEFSQQQNRINLTQRGQPQLAYLDAYQMQSVIKNLLSNALKFSQELVEIELIWQPKTVTLRFCDRGIGIPKHEQDEILRLFYRAANAGHIPGSGTGLSRVKRAVELHNGSMTIESELAQGTTVSVILPIQTSENVTAETTKVKQTQSLM